MLFEKVNLVLLYKQIKNKIMEILIKILGGLLAFAGTILLLAVLLGLPTMWLWNWLMTYLFDFKEIGFLQAVGMLMLSGLLFKSSGKND